MSIGLATTSRAAMIGALLCGLAAPAPAMPVDSDEIDFVSLPGKRPFSCPPNASWTKLKRCLETQDKLIMLRDLENAKLIKLQGKATPSPSVVLYLKISGQWLRAQFYGDLSTYGELLEFAPLADGAYRIEMGYAYPTSVALDDVTVTPGLLRRKMTFVCIANGLCYSVVTSCEVTVRGKAYWWFRGKLVWDGKTTRVSGDPTNAGTQCQVPAAMLAPSPAPPQKPPPPGIPSGDPLL